MYRQESCKLAEGHLLEGLDIGLLTMKKGERAVFTLKPQYAFKELGAPPRIPPNCTVEYEVELVHFTTNLPMEKPVDLEDRFRRAAQFRLDGNYEYARKAYRKAARAYNSGLALFGGVYNLTQEEQIRASDIKLCLALNLAQCSLLLKDPKKAILNAQRALEIDPENPKALFRMAKGNAEIGNFELAEEQLMKTDQLVPNDPLIKNELATVKVKLQQAQRNSANLFKGIFGKWNIQPISEQISITNGSPVKPVEKINNTEELTAEFCDEIEEDFEEDDIYEEDNKQQDSNELLGWN